MASVSTVCVIHFDQEGCRVARFNLQSMHTIDINEFYNAERFGRHLMESKEKWQRIIMGLLDDWQDSAVVGTTENVIQSLQTKH